jgi:ABC-2 type transport system ATP-binding protein
MERIKKDTTIFFSTHILDDVQRIADYLVILNQGKILVQGAANDLLEGEENLESLFISLVEKKENND